MTRRAVRALLNVARRRGRQTCGGLLGVVAACLPRCELRAQGNRPPEPPSGPSWLERLTHLKSSDAAPDTVPTDTTARTGRRVSVPCLGQRIDDVVVVTQPPYTSGLLAQVAFVGRTVRALHATTRTDVVRRFLLLHPGDRCSDALRRESERILRAQPFLVDARITTFPNEDGGVTLEVETRDEFSAIVQMAARTSAPVVTNVRLGEANLAGAAIYTSVQWYDGGPGYRDGFAARIIDHQFLGRPWRLTLEGRRRDVGGEWRTDLTHPFYTDFQRVAWRVLGGGTEDHLELMRPRDQDANALFYHRGYGSIGGVARIGPPGRLALIGGSMSTEHTWTEDRVAVLSDTGEIVDRGQPLGFRPSGRYPEQRAVRANVILGFRRVTFLRATGFDALTGGQDVRRGFQIGTVAGRGFSWLGSDENDLFLSADIYGGLGTARSFGAMELQGEGRNANDIDRWNGIVTSGRAAYYLVPNDRLRTVASLEYAGTWRPLVPMQLALGALDGGVRGFRTADAVGARRVVSRLEERWVLGTPFGLGDIGLAGFVDAGRTYAGRAPYGTTTPVQASVGLGVLGAFPPRSRRVWRVDLALPVTHTPGSRFQVLFSNRDLTQLFWREPRDVQMGREQAVPASVFNWP